MASTNRPELDEAAKTRRFGRLWTLRVASARNIAPRMRRVQLTADDLSEFTPQAGQELVFQINEGAGEALRRHYTIRRFDRSSGLIDVDFVLHGHESPGERWALRAKPGDRIDVRGPRGRMELRLDADWHLMSGDETGIPGIFALLESMPPGTRAFVLLEIGADEDKLPVSTAAQAQITWLVRGSEPASTNRQLLEAIEAFQSPAGVGHVYLIGETGKVRAQRHALLARGIQKQQIWAEGYWRPGRLGGHDHIED